MRLPFFRRPTLRMPRDSAGHVHLPGRFEFERFFGGLAERRRNWQAVALVCLFVNLALTVGFVLLALSHRVVPYVVEVDRLGEARSVGRLAQSAPPERAVEVVLRRFVHNLRTVPTDARLLNARLKEARAHADGRALDTFLKDVGGARKNLEDMLRRGDARYVEEISSVLRVPGDNRVYHVAWREIIRQKSSETACGYEGYFRLELSPPDSEEELLSNPFGVWITDYTVTEIARGEGT